MGLPKGDLECEKGRDTPSKRNVRGDEFQGESSGRGLKIPGKIQRGLLSEANSKGLWASSHLPPESSACPYRVITRERSEPADS